MTRRQGRFVIRLLERVDGAPSRMAGRCLTFYDPDAGDGRGVIRTTAHPVAARRFATPDAAMAFYRRPAAPPHDRWPDGSVNRPLTAWTIEVTTVRQALGWGP